MRHTRENRTVVNVLNMYLTQGYELNDYQFAGFAGIFR